MATTTVRYSTLTNWTYDENDFTERDDNDPRYGTEVHSVMYPVTDVQVDDYGDQLMRDHHIHRAEPTGDELYRTQTDGAQQGSSAMQLDDETLYYRQATYTTEDGPQTNEEIVDSDLNEISVVVDVL